MKSKSKIIISILTIFVVLYSYFIFANMYNAIYSPKSPKSDISSLLSKKVLTTEEYSILYSQTGLAPQAIKDLLSQNNGFSNILNFQDSYYEKNKIYSKKLNPFTIEENFIITTSTSYKSFQIAPLKNGDIILTKSTHTLYWRHGHCGIVIDAKRGITLESLEPGTISMEQNISKWLSYPTIKVMRLKGANQKKLDAIAKYAENNLNGIDYDIFASKNQKNKINVVNCSQLIYQAFIRFGYDLDSNSGIFVTPEDISKSKLLEIVQIRGFNPKKDW